jgi:hypothetical protein
VLLVGSWVPVPASCCATRCRNGILSTPSHSRAQARENDVLITVRRTVEGADLRRTVARTRAVRERDTALRPGVLFQDEAGRLWAVCWRLACASRRAGSRAL